MYLGEDCCGDVNKGVSIVPQSKNKRSKSGTAT